VWVWRGRELEVEWKVILCWVRQGSHMYISVRRLKWILLIIIVHSYMTIITP